MSEDEKFLLRCIELAANGLGNVAPNPMVGAVIVCDGKIIGEGFHRQFGKAHAEVHAINDVLERHREDLFAKSTLFVNLEPCVHVGKTPPCTDLIIEKKIKRVVIGNIDPFEKVSGSGIKKLATAGVEVVHGTMEKECRVLNKRFFTFHEKKRPYIILKYAQSRDGFLSAEKTTRENRWITNEISRQRVHQWRSEEQAIMIGTNTARFDNPFLTVRDWAGKNPIRIVLDQELKLDRNLHVFNSSAPTLVFNEIKNDQEANIEFIRIDFKKEILSQIMKALHKKNILSVFVEGGRMLLQSFIDEKLWDESRIFTGDQFLEKGTQAPVINGALVSEENILNDHLRILSNTPF